MKILHIELWGEKFTLNVGVGRFYHLFKEATGKDLLSFTDGFDTTRLMDVTFGIIYAGYYAECKLNKTQPKYTKEQLYDIVMDSESDKITDIFRQYNELVQPGEPKSQQEKEPA